MIVPLRLPLIAKIASLNAICDANGSEDDVVGFSYQLLAGIIGRKRTHLTVMTGDLATKKKGLWA